MTRLLYLLVLLAGSALARRSGGGGSHHGGGGTNYGGYGGGSHNYGTGHTYSGHSYPPSNDLSGHGHSTHTHTQAAAYPPSTGLSGNNKSPHVTTHQQTEVHHHKTEVHHHHYSPPQQISYGTGYHPVYHHPPPVYVYEYRNSGSRFDTLLTGLALYNLGKMSAHNDHNSHSHYDANREYRGTPGETCKMQITKSNGEYEETRIDCKLMSSFIWEAEQEQNKAVSSNTVTVTKVENTVTNNNNGSTVVTTTTQNTTVVDALTAKGPSIQVTPGMNCYMIRILNGYSTIKKKVDCGLLQTYAMNSFSKCSRNLPTSVVLFMIILISWFH